ncbi:hypothetical protein V5F22_12780 [Acinetobacter baumannii]
MSIAFEIEDSDDLTFSNIRIEGFNLAVKAKSSKGLKFNNIEVDEFKKGFYLKDCKDIELYNVNLNQSKTKNPNFQLNNLTYSIKVIIQTQR